ncbi:MAG: hypothetical protein HOQ32_07625 [Lysobacter sp.]|nr:hypothetical protein [Lysobacter sp.]
MNDSAIYAVYLIWLLAGGLDFACHRRTDLASTSGLRESALHLLQLALMGGGIVLWLALPIGRALLAVLVVVVAAHAVLGYLDTRQAYGRRDIRPFEQHLHSVLDIAPVAALCWVAVTTAGGADDERITPLPVRTWAAVLVPAVALCVIPACLEFRHAWTVARAGAPSARPVRG